MEEQKISEGLKTKLENLIKSLYDNPKCLEFRFPVDWEAFGLTDYPEIIKNPMDLDSVLKKLNNDEYETLKDWFADMCLIWNNCKCYNRQGSVSLLILS